MAGLNIVKSVESVTETLTGNTSNIALTKGQVPENCVPFLTYRIPPAMSSYSDAYFTDVTITGTTSDPRLNLYRYDSTSECYEQLYIVEFNPDEIKVQTGSFFIDDGFTEGTATISGVNTSKSMLVCKHSSSSHSQTLYNCAVGHAFATASGLQFTRGGTAGDISGHYYVIEDLNDNFDVAHFDISMNSAALDVETPDASNMYNTMVLGSFAFSSTSASPRYNCMSMYLRTEFSVMLTKDLVGYAHYCSLQQITFNVPDSVRMVIRNHLTLAAALGDVYDWELDEGVAVNLDTSMVHNPISCGTNKSNTTIASYFTEQYATYSLTSSSGVRIERGQSNYVNYFSPEIVDWAGYTTRSGIASVPKIPELDAVGSMVKSIENVDFNFTGSSYEYVLTKGQNSANCVPFISQSVSAYSAYEILMDVYFLEPDILRFSSFGSTCTHTVKGSIVEFEPDQVRVQQGQFFTTETEALVTISGVDLTKTALKSYHQLSNTQIYFNYTSQVRGSFTTAS